MLFFLIGDIHSHPLTHLGSASSMKFPPKVLLGLQFASSDKGRAEHSKVWMDPKCFSKQKQLLGPWSNEERNLARRNALPQYHHFRYCT